VTGFLHRLEQHCLCGSSAAYAAEVQDALVRLMIAFAEPD